MDRSTMSSSSSLEQPNPSTGTFPLEIAAAKIKGYMANFQEAVDEIEGRMKNKDKMIRHKDATLRKTMNVVKLLDEQLGAAIQKWDAANASGKKEQETESTDETEADEVLKAAKVFQSEAKQVRKGLGELLQAVGVVEPESETTDELGELLDAVNDDEPEPSNDDAVFPTGPSEDASFASL